MMHPKCDMVSIYIHAHACIPGIVEPASAFKCREPLVIRYWYRWWYIWGQREKKTNILL